MSTSCKHPFYKWCQKIPQIKDLFDNTVKDLRRNLLDPSRKLKDPQGSLQGLGGDLK